jgi:hypothetical protein
LHQPEKSKDNTSTVNLLFADNLKVVIQDTMDLITSTFYSIGLFALGFVPTLTALELSWRMAYKLGKRDRARADPVADGTSSSRTV